MNKLHEDRVKVLKKIEELEYNGTFDIDVEDDPETYPLLPEDIDYLRSKPVSKLKANISYMLANKFVKNEIKKGNLIIKEIKGLENLKEIKDTGAIITCNHFNPYDSFAVEVAIKDTFKHKRIYRVIREGNYTNFPGFYGFLFKNCYTLPLSSNGETMIKFYRSVTKLLEKKELIFICPEQSMWWNYKKPKPLKNGAYHLAVKNNVPIIPIFITLTESNKLGEDEFPIMEYHINIGKVIYPDKSLKGKDAINKMRDENFLIWKNIYEDFYNKPLEYTTRK